MSMLPTSGTATGAIESPEIILHKDPAIAAKLTDQGALRLVSQDAKRAEMWMDSKQYALAWREADVLYQSPRTQTAWENSGTSRANVSRFTVAKHLNALVPTMMSGIFYDDPPFVYRPRPGTTQATVRAKKALHGALLDDMDFKVEVESGMESQVLNGTGIWKYGHCTTRKVEKRYKRKTPPASVAMPFGGDMQVHTAESDEFDCIEIPVTKWRPFFEHKPLGSIMVDPGWRKANRIGRAKYLIERAYVTFNDLNKLREVEGYTIPDEETLKKVFIPTPPAPLPPSGVEAQQQANGSVHHAAGRDERTTEDPLEQPIELLERWDQDRVMVVLDGKLVIRNESHSFGQIPYLSANWWNIQNAGYGLGIGRLIGSDQRVEQGATNAALDILSLAVNPQAIRSRGANAPTQQIRSRLGGIIDVDGDIDKAFKWSETPKVPPEVWTMIQTSKQASESVTGADEAMVQGSMPQKGGSSIGRTATGAGNLAAASAARIQGPVGRFVDNVFLPFLDALDDMCNEHMPLSEIREILSDELTDDIKVDFNNFLNARLKREVLAGAHLAAKKAMAQTLPLMIQIFENPHMLQSLNATGWTVDLKELFEMFMEMSEWKNSRDVIRKMTNDEAAAYQASQNPMAGKLQGDIEKIKAKGQVDGQLNDNKAEARLAEKLLTSASDRATGYAERVAMERAIEPRALGDKQEPQFTTT